MQLVDTHAHLDDEQFAGHEAEVLDRSRRAGVVQVIAIGITVESSRRSVELARNHAGVYASVGIHPNSAAQAKAGDWAGIEELVGLPEVVAVGETGLDRYRDYTPFDVQRDYFLRHIELSQRSGRPFVVHCRDAEAEVLDCLREAAASGPLRGVMHSFTGSPETAQLCLDLGLFISFAGMVTFKKVTELRDVAAGVPLDRLLVETDSPYLSPEPFRGKTNEPARVAHTARCLAERHGITLEQFADRTSANARRLFGLPPIRTQPEYS
jgi:TatD DNase family protein